MSTPGITVCVLARNEAGKIEHALASVAKAPWCVELLVYDSGSTDDTVAIAKRFTDRVEHHDWIDYTHNKKLICDAAKTDWVMILDADEELSPALVKAIGDISDEAFAAASGFTMPRRNFLFGRHVLAWDPDRVDRLFNRQKVRWLQRSVHDRREPIEGQFEKLKAPLLHRPSVDDWGDFYDGERFQKRTEALPRELFNNGKHARPSDLWLRPALTFLKFFVLKRGFLQGTFGLLVARKAGMSVGLKYARLWYLQNHEQRAAASAAYVDEAETAPNALEAAENSDAKIIEGVGS